MNRKVYLKFLNVRLVGDIGDAQPLLAKLLALLDYFEQVAVAQRANSSVEVSETQRQAYEDYMRIYFQSFSSN